uniref:RGS domain-containing protein n=1 Tax=Parastrongyloides trichosuri TaxID=131310 RepID=A0A0N4ZW79_PARTI
MYAAAKAKGTFVRFRASRINRNNSTSLDTTPIADTKNILNTEETEHQDNLLDNNTLSNKKRSDSSRKNSSGSSSKKRENIEELEAKNTSLSAEEKPIEIDSIPTNKSSIPLEEKTQSKIPVSSSKMSSATNMFDLSAKTERKAPLFPPIDDIEYPRAASWVSGTVKDLLDDKIGKQVFMCFLFECLAEENLLFVDDIKRLKDLKNKEERKKLMQELLDRCTTTINVSSKALQAIKKEIVKDDPDITCFDLADKEVSKLLENDQFPRFRRSTLYLDFLEKLLPKAYAVKWSSSFEALLGNQVGRHYFRKFLQSIHAEENLRFWEAVVEFRSAKNKSLAMTNLGKNIQQQFLREGTHNEVFLPFGLRQTIEKKIQQKDVDITLFDEAIKHVEQILKNDPYVRFLQSKDYLNLLEKLK